MSLAGPYNMTADLGATFSLVITWKDATGSLINLTGFTAAMDLRDDFGESAVLSLSTANGRISLGWALGTITLSVDAADMVIGVGSFLYDLEVTSSVGVVTRVIMGSFTTRAQVTS